MRVSGLYGVRTGSDRSAFAGPISMKKLAARFIQPFVGVRAEIIPLRLEHADSPDSARNRISLWLEPPLMFSIKEPPCWLRAAHTIAFSHPAKAVVARVTEHGTS